MLGAALIVPQPQTLADDGVEEALRLAGAGAGGNQSGLARGDRAEGLFLVAVDGGKAPRNALAEVGVLQASATSAFTVAPSRKGRERLT